MATKDGMLYEVNDRAYEVARAEVFLIASLLDKFDDLQKKIRELTRQQADIGSFIKGSVDVVGQLRYLSYDWLVKFLNDYKTESVDALAKRIMEIRRQ